MLQADQDIVDRKAELEQARVQLQHEKEYETIKHKIVQVLLLLLAVHLGRVLCGVASAFKDLRGRGRLCGCVGGGPGSADAAASFGPDSAV